MRIKIMKRFPAVLAAAGLAILLPGPAWAASGPQPASGTVLVTSVTVDSSSAADGNTILVITISGLMNGTFDGTFTETDQEVIHPDGTITLAGKGMQSGTLGTCGTGSAAYVIEAQGTAAAVTGRFQFIDQSASTSTPTKIHSVVTFTGSTITGQFTYTGTYYCT